MDQLILNAAEAEAIYSAMCALNNVNGRIGAVHMGLKTVTVDPQERIHVYEIGRPGAGELYVGQHAFCTAYLFGAAA